MKPATPFPMFQPTAPVPERDQAAHAAAWEAMEQRSPVGLYQTDAAGLCVYVNSRWCELAGLGAEDALGDGWARALHPEDRERVFAAWSRAAETSSPFSDEYRFLHPDGSVVWVYGQATPEVDDNGAVIAFVGSITDITERKRGEDALRESEERFRSLVSVITDVPWTADAAGAFVTMQPTWAAYTGQTWDEMRGFGWTDALHPDDREMARRNRDRAVAEQTTYESRGRLWHAPAGEYRHYFARATPLRNTDGGIREWVGACTDVHERTLAEEALRESQAHLAALIDQSISGIAETDLSGRFTLVNDCYCEITGYARDELLGKLQMQEITHPDDVPRNIALFQRLVESGIPFTIEKRYVRKDGAIVWVNNSVSAIRDEAGRPRSAVAVVVDITERKRGEDAIRESERKLQLLADAMPQVVWVADASGVVRYTNSRVAELAGMGQTADGSWDWQLSLHPDDLPPALAAWRAALAAKEPYVHEHRLRMSGGGYRWHLSRAVPILTADGDIEAWYGTATDIHDLKESEIARRENEERLRLGIEVAGFALLEVDYAAGVIHLSAEAARLYGLGDEAVTVPRERVHATFHPDDREEMVRRIGIPPDPEAAPSYTAEYRVVWPSGEVRWLSVRKQIVFNRSGPVPRPERAVLAALDITERKRAEMERVAFVDAAAHDLRTPLTSLKAQAQLLARRVRRGQMADTASIEAGLAAIDAAATRMVTLIDEMMDAAHLRAGRSLELRLAPTDLVALAETAVEETRRGTTRNVVHIEKAVPALVGEWDEVRLGRVLGNLLGNAVKYSPRGGDIVVRLGREDDANGAWAVVAVSDQGIGIPAADLPRLFGQFHRGGNVASIGGSGIGLAGAWQIVAQLGGTIAVESEEGRGSTFTVRLPLGHGVWVTG